MTRVAGRTRLVGAKHPRLRCAPLAPAGAAAEYPGVDPPAEDPLDARRNTPPGGDQHRHDRVAGTAAPQQRSGSTMSSLYVESIASNGCGPGSILIR